MTKRQKMLGVTDWGYYKGIKKGEFLGDNEAFLAKASTLKKGEYKIEDIEINWLGFEESLDLRRFFRGLSVTHNKYFNFTETHGLNVLTVK